jgi:hypothetical protein
MAHSRHFARTRATRLGPTLLAMAALLGACGGDDSVAGPESEACGPAPYFTVLPVPAASLRAVTVVGGVDAPGHTLPTDHGGIFLQVPSAPLRSPGDMTITSLVYGSAVGNGQSDTIRDYAITFQVCRELTGWFGHVPALAPRLLPESVVFTNCRSYSTPFAEYETCEARNLNIRVSAGDEIGTAGPGTDIGMIDQRVNNSYVSPQRFPGLAHAVCMWDPFDAATQSVLYSKLRDLRRPAIEPEGEPRCGTMEVDVPGTAKGVWAEPGVTGPLGPDERRYMALVDYPYRPQDELALSLGPDALGAHVAFVDRTTSGRVNRAFEDVTPDGQIYCYGPEVEYFTVSSWFLELTSATALTIERIEHGPGPSPCADDPTTWSFGPNAVSMVR